MSTAHPEHIPLSGNRSAQLPGFVRHGLTWLCAAIAIVAIIAFVAQSWPLLLFALGIVSVVQFVVGYVRKHTKP